jgi:hypothetical protein
MSRKVYKINSVTPPGLYTSDYHNVLGWQVLVTVNGEKFFLNSDLTMDPVKDFIFRDNYYKVDDAVDELASSIRRI